MASELTVILHGDRWRLADVEKNVAWAKTVKWTKSKWLPRAEQIQKDDRHDHCQICWWALYFTEKEEEGTGYKDEASRLWLCLECYDLFVKESVQSS
jgi:Zn-finger protein